MEKALVIGASGQVGAALFKQLSTKLVVVGTYNSTKKNNLVYLDVNESKNVEKLINEIKPSYVFICSAIISIDFCEQNPEIANKVNVEGTKNIVKAAKKIGAKVIFLSTEYIFDGKKGPYKEGDSPNPLNVYGRTKLESEKIVLSLKKSLVVRSTLVFSLGYDEHNLLHVIVKNLKAGKKINIVDDQITNPISADNLAEAITDLSLRDKSGIYNIASPKRMSRYEFAIKAANVFGLDIDLVKAVKTSVFRQKVNRPLSCGLVVDKFKKNSRIRLLGVEEAVSFYKSKVV
ncbi:MAG: SDR family oxidoreductase [Nanoarchaeota archaeon]